MDLFLYDRNLRHQRVKQVTFSSSLIHLKNHLSSKLGTPSYGFIYLSFNKAAHDNYNKQLERKFLFDKHFLKKAQSTDKHRHKIQIEIG